MTTTSLIPWCTACGPKVKKCKKVNPRCPNDFTLLTAGESDALYRKWAYMTVMNMKKKNKVAYIAIAPPKP